MSDGWGESVEPSKEETQVLSANFLDRFKPAEEIPEVEAFKLGVFAPDKYGKTDICARTTPLPVYVFDTENKFHIAIGQLPDERRKQFHLINLWTDPQCFDANGKHDKSLAIKYMKETLEGICDMNLKNGTIVIDSLSVVWAWIQDWFQNSKDIQRNASGQPYRFEYGKPNQRFLQIGELLQRTRMNVVCTMKSKAKVNSDGSDAGFNIMECQKHTGYFLEFYGELERVGKNRTFIVKGTNYGDLEGMKIDNPDFEKIKNAISKETGIKFNSGNSKTEKKGK
jgi:hypothetical protein